MFAPNGPWCLIWSDHGWVGPLGLVLAGPRQHSKKNTPVFFRGGHFLGRTFAEILSEEERPCLHWLSLNPGDWIRAEGQGHTYIHTISQHMNLVF